MQVDTQAKTTKRDNGNVHRAAAKIIVSKSRAARGSVCNVLLSRVCRRVHRQDRRILMARSYGVALVLASMVSKLLRSKIDRPSDECSPCTDTKYSVSSSLMLFGGDHGKGLRRR